ncbi:MAG: DNA/RNA helicase, superfamily I [Methanobacterium sp. Maddingley MBC34]|nr:MAG: DNA/RNA helicase, superfamily I [Methanobacterium sp. Maddingley MBC34]
MSELSKVDIYRQIDVLRQSLLDLTMRNQLLNFRPRSMTVEVTEGELAEIYDRLVLKKSKRKLLQFIPRADSETTTGASYNKNKGYKDRSPGYNDNTHFENKEDHDSDVDQKSPLTGGSQTTTGKSLSTTDNGIKKVDHGDFSADELVKEPQFQENDLEDELSTSDDIADDTEAPDEVEVNSPDFSDTEMDNEALAPEESLLWEAPSLDQETLEKNKEIFLSTDLTPSELQRRLFYINQRARSMMEEQGYNILYLAMGFLKWQESNGTPGDREAPLILIPVELERRRVKGSFKLRWTGEDIIPNISLQAKLLDYGVEIPDFEMPRTQEGVDEYLDQVNESISHEKGWEVKDKVYLGFFSFTKFVMYKDLDPESWPEDMPLEENPLIKAIFDPAEEELSPGFQEDQVDVKLSSEDVYHVMDADSSQIAVIEDVKHGRDLVVEGPPGTGKSQTIVNLIAELLARGNTVLFVSEKMAALEVVKGRLDRVGLGEFCLELHSKKSQKKDVLEKLESVLRNPKPIDLSMDDDLSTIEELKSDLNEYVTLLHSPYAKINWTPYQLFGVKERSLHHFEKIGTKMPRFVVKNSKTCTLREWQRTINKFKELGELYKLVKPVSYNPWKYTHPDPILPAEEEEIETLLDETVDTLHELNLKAENLSKISGVNIPVTLEDTEHLIATVEIISSFPSLERELILNTKWDYDKLQVYNLIKSLEEYKAKTKGLKRFKEGVLDEDISSLLINFQEQKPKLLKFLSGDFKKAKKRIGKLYLGKTPENDEVILQDLEELIKCQKLQLKIRAQDELARSLFGSHWKREESEAENLKAISEWILKFRQALEEGRITEKILIILDSAQQYEIKQITREMHQDYDQILDYINQLDSYLHFDPDSALGNSLTKSPIDYLVSQISLLKVGLSGLQNWSRFSSSRVECLETVGKNLVELADKDEIEATDIIPCLEGNFADSLLRSLFLQEPSLSRFVGEVHEKKINEFRELDSKIINLNRFRIAQELHQNRPSLSGTASPRSELGVLKSEFSRKRGHMPIRKLLSICGGIIQSIKPCFMMSPLSIAQYLDPYSVKNLRFDYVIFDEASQVKPEDALGALLRARCAVIMGDTRQLPPTSFFDILIDVESDDYDLAVLADMESILHLCKRSFPSKMLRWHYRSRHESLIAVSNQEFYDNHLLIYPSPSQDSEELGLKLVHLPETVYDRGKTATNRAEAKAVIKAVFDHYQKYGSTKSLGVGTFNVRQQQAILEELELQLKLNPKMESYFKGNHGEHFFVKNLETIQGDERDVIMVSVGYGFDSEGNLSHNFGPVNQDGGERRLNVLLTRAREKCLIFSNFRGRDLQLSSSAPFGLRALKEFLEYAEKKTLTQQDLVQNNADDAFEEAVSEFLTEHGYEIHRRVGCAGFRVDLAVVDPEYPGRYLLGIACDGPMYQTSRVARDRDRLRQQILKGLGWRFYRLWSTDWYRNRADVQKRLLAIIEELLKEERAEEVIPPVEEDGIDSPVEDLEDGESVISSTEDGTDQEKDTDLSHVDEAVPPIPNGKGEIDSPLNDLPPNDSSLNDSPLDTSSLDETETHSKRLEIEEKEETNYSIENSTDFPELEEILESEKEESEKESSSDSQMRKEGKEELSNYMICEDTGVPVSGDIHSQPVGDIARAAMKVVEVEGPIHYNEVVKRIRTYWGLSRAGRRVQTVMKEAINLGLMDGQIIQKGDFLYYKDAPVVVRRRTGNPPAKMDLISPEEIAAAVKIILKSQYATQTDELIREVSRLFGAKVTRGPAISRIKGVIDDLIQKGEIEERPDGMVDLIRE